LRRHVVCRCGFGSGRRAAQPADPGASARSACMSTLHDAAALYGQGRVREAQVLCRDILTREPANAGVLHLLGVITYQSGDAAAGAALIGKAVALNPRDAEAQCNLAAALMDSGAYAAAVAAADAAIVLNPQFARAHANRDAAIINWAKALKKSAGDALMSGD